MPSAYPLRRARSPSRDRAVVLGDTEACGVPVERLRDGVDRHALAYWPGGAPSKSSRSAKRRSYGRRSSGRSSWTVR